MDSEDFARLKSVRETLGFTQAEVLEIAQQECGMEPDFRLWLKCDRERLVQELGFRAAIKKVTNPTPAHGQ